MHNWRKVHKGDALWEPDAPIVRFQERYDVNEDDCWIWNGAVDRAGYGKFGIRKQTFRAHKWRWEHEHGPVPDGLVLDHLCRVTSCVNPNHLEPVTPLENTMRGDHPAAVRRRNGFCHRGHPLEGDNVRIPAAHPERWVCVACRAENNRRYRERQAAKA
jgi:hypothetical protein